MKTLGSILGLNQGIPTNVEELLEKIRKIENCISER